MSSHLAVALMEGALEYLAGLLFAADEAREVLLAEEGGGSEARGDLAVSIMLPPGRRYYWPEVARFDQRQSENKL